MANIYDKGDLVRVTVTFSVGGVTTDPTTITLKVKNPAGTVATYTYALAQIVKSATGIYYKDISVTTSGAWYYNFAGTGTVEAADENGFAVKASEFS